MSSETRCGSKPSKHFFDAMPTNADSKKATNILISHNQSSEDSEPWESSLNCISCPEGTPPAVARRRCITSGYRELLPRRSREICRKIRVFEILPGVGDAAKKPHSDHPDYYFTIIASCINTNKSIAHNHRNCFMRTERTLD
jgi:hypothetical protein